jgi:hypothetical protein
LKLSGSVTSEEPSLISAIASAPTSSMRSIKLSPSTQAIRIDAPARSAMERSASAAAFGFTPPAFVTTRTPCSTNRGRSRPIIPITSVAYPSAGSFARARVRIPIVISASASKKM